MLVAILGHDSMVYGFTPTYAISAYHHQRSVVAVIAWHIGGHLIRHLEADPDFS